MKWLAQAAAVLASAASAHPHSSVDQQAQVILGPSGVEVVWQITPSTEAGAAMFDAIDSDGDGAVSAREASDFGRLVMAMSPLEVDGQGAALRLTSASVPPRDLAAMGEGVIVIRAASDTTPIQSVSFDVGFESFSHDWFIQPYVRDGVGVSSIMRMEGSARVRVDLTGA
jgi:hypothetical protein